MNLNRIIALTLACVVLALTGCMPGTSISAGRLTTEYRENPVGLAATRPRLGWKLAAGDSGAHNLAQSAYRIIAARTPEDLDHAAKLVWDTGVVGGEAGSRTNQIEYAGMALASRDRVWWKVQVWDQEARDCGWSTPASFTVGLVDQKQWTAQWIGLDSEPAAPLTREMREEFRRRPWIRLPGAPGRAERVALFRSEFTLNAGTIKKAWVAGTADMVADVRINGLLAARLTRWDLLEPLDVTRSLKAGVNAIGIRVENHDGFNPAVTGMLVVQFADGKEQRVLLDKSFKLLDATPAAGVPAGWDKTGFDASTWKAPEESPNQPWGGNRNTEHYFSPSPYLRTTFVTTAGKTVARATLYSTALGVYEAHLNGARIGTGEFAPGWTEYTKRVEHQTADVTAMVASGSTNCLAAVVGDGWYAGLMGYTGRRNYYGGPSRFLAQLEIEYTDGTMQTVATGPSWQGTFGPIRHTDNYMGSEYDSRLEIPGWDAPKPSAEINWKPVHVGLAQRPHVREFDVTEKVRAALKAPAGSFIVNPANLGEPAFNVLKTLRIDYTTGGKARSITFKEGESVNFPRPGEDGDVVIVKAMFGEPLPPPLPAFVIEPQQGEPVRRFEELAAKGVKEPRAGRYVFDLGQNMVGWTRLKVRGDKGQRITVRHAEMLNPDGTLYQSNLRGATQADFYVLNGSSQTLEAPFTFHGFQYVEVTGLNARPDASMVTGIVAHTDMKPVGTFACSNPLVNQLVHNIVWGQKGNYFEVPTDCPQRDERLGWTGDAQFFVNTAAFSFDIASFMTRWLKTLNQDAQFPDGTFAHVAPKVNERGGSTAWGDAAIVCTNSIYHTYADTRVISDNYEAMSRYMAWLDGKTKDGIAKVGGFGDWVNLGDPTSPDLIDTAYRAELCRMMGEMAGVIGKADDARKFAAAHAATVAAFRARFLAADGQLKESGQTGYALAFTMGLIPAEMREKAAVHFAAAIEKKNWHLATGFIGTPRLLPGLYGAGRSAVASRLLMNDDYPSWLYQVKLGATTMWERWDGWTPERGFQDVGMNSFNHYAFGAVGDFLYRNVAGISPASPGYRTILIAPTPIPGLEHAAATYDSPCGLIKSAWRRTSTGIEYDITIPPNARAEIRLPGLAGGPVRVGSGSYHYTVAK
ncbi:MAG: family 78 glycoside hydrolase catalytic domain [Planctomycetota bacterium]